MADNQPIHAPAAPQGSKTCFKCRESKPLTEFYRHSEMADGYLGKCKSCTKSDVAANYSARREQYSEYERERNKTEHRRAKKSEYERRYRINNPDKNKARRLVRQALRKGKLVKPACCDGCRQAKPLEAHHFDYSKPLDVRWFCFDCHRTIGHGQSVTCHDYAHAKGGAA